MNTATLDSERWRRLTELFDRAVELDITARREWLERECAGDPALRRELEKLLAADVEPSLMDALDQAHARAAEALLAGERGETPTGQRIGVWRIERLLGHGGMGRVYLAARDDGEFEQHVALKLLRPELIDDAARRRFLEERRLLARLQHPHIARLFDGGLGPDGQPWYAMEYVDGAPLTQWCDARGLGIAARLDLFRTVCEAVDYAHRQLVIHRDLKPANILVDAQGAPKLLDFGIAKLIAGRDALTRSDTRLMTPEYAAPEQLRREPVSTATDIYALGAILFELLTGRRAFPDPLAAREPPSAQRACAGDDDDVRQRASACGLSPQQLRRRLRGDLERILRAALDPDPARRYRSADALAEDLRRHLAGRPISLRRDRLYRLGKFVRRHRIGVAASAVGVVALAAAFAFALWQAREARRQADTANAVRDFMVEVFAGANPEQHPGAQPTARELLDAGARRLTGRFSDQPELESALQEALAKSYAGIGAYDRARPLALDALKAALRLHRADSEPVIAARVEYAEILSDGGQVQEARKQARLVLQATGDAASTASVRAHVLLAQDDNQLMHAGEAIGEARHALAQAVVLGPQTALWQAMAWEEIAGSSLTRGDFDAATRAMRRAADLYAQSRGETAAQTFDARNDLIFMLLHTGHADEAVALYAKQVDEQRRILGPNHPDFAATLCRYAYVLWDAGRYRLARQTADEAWRAMQTATDMSAAQRGHDLSLLAMVAHERGDYAGALRILDEVARIYRPLGSDVGRNAFSLQWEQAGIAAERGQAGAVARLDQLRDLSFNLHHPLLWGDQFEWPLALAARGDYAGALVRWRQIAAEKETASQPARRDEVLLGEGIALVESGDGAAGRRALAEALTAFGNDPQHGMQAVTAKLWRGWSWVREGAAAKGLPDVEAAWAGPRDRLGDDSWYTAEAHLARAEALALLGRRTEAAAEQAVARNGLAVLDPADALRRRAALPLPH